MAVIAKGGITLTSVNDACSVFLSSAICVIPANYDGSDPVLDNAFTDISFICGNIKCPASAVTVMVTDKSDEDIECSISSVDDYTKRLSITSVPESVTHGFIGLKISFSGIHFNSVFSFIVEKDIAGIVASLITGKKDVQEFVPDPDPDGYTITVIASISQDENGQITVTKKTIRSASASSSGVVTTGAQTIAGNKTFTGQLIGLGGVAAKGITDLTVPAFVPPSMPEVNQDYIDSILTNMGDALGFSYNKTWNETAQRYDYIFFLE